MLPEDSGHGSGLDDALPGAQPQGAAGQRIQQTSQIRVTRSACNEGVEGEVVGCQLEGCRLGGDRIQAVAQGCETAGIYATGGMGRGTGLQDAADFHELRSGSFLMDLHHEAHGFGQQGGLQTGDIGTVPAPHIEDTDEFQCLDGLTQRASGQAQLVTQFVLRRKPVSCPQLPADEHFLDLGNRFIGNSHPTILSGPGNNRGRAHMVRRTSGPGPAHSRPLGRSLGPPGVGDQLPVKTGGRRSAKAVAASLKSWLARNAVFQSCT